MTDDTTREQDEARLLAATSRDAALRVAVERTLARLRREEALRAARIRRMGVRVEVWPVTADAVGLWLVSADGLPWWSDEILVTSEAHKEVEELLREHDEFRSAVLVHQTSCRTEGESFIATYVAVLGSHGRVGWRTDNLPRTYTFARDIWEHARPITQELNDLVGRPPYHGPLDAPAPRYVDVLRHAMKHLRYLLDNDAHVRAALDNDWKDHLATWRPALAGMYQHTFPEAG